MSGSAGGRSRGGARQVLGLAQDFSPADLEGAYHRLRAHIAARAEAAEEPTFLAARRAELEELDRLFASLRSKAAAPGRAAPGGGRFWLAVWAASATLAALALGLALRLAPAREEPPAMPPEPASLAVRAEPIGAQLAILASEDEQVVANGPADGARYEVEPGDYRLRVTRADCPDEWLQEVQIGPGESRQFAPRICRGVGQLVVRSNVSGDRVRIDDLDVGSTGEAPHSLAVGDHQIAVEKRGFQPWTGTVRIRPDEALTLRAELEPEAGLPAAKPLPAGRAASEAPRPPPPVAASGTVAPEAGSSPGRDLEERVAGAKRGGSKRWHDAVVERLLAAYDSNGSKTLDTPEEINAIPCTEWRSIEASYETGGLGIPMTRLYGFDGSAAPPNTLGITPSMGGYAYDRMKQCGLK